MYHIHIYLINRKGVLMSIPPSQPESISMPQLRDTLTQQFNPSAMNTAIQRIATEDRALYGRIENSQSTHTHLTTKDVKVITNMVKQAYDELDISSPSSQGVTPTSPTATRPTMRELRDSLREAYGKDEAKRCMLAADTHLAQSTEPQVQAALVKAREKNTPLSLQEEDIIRKAVFDAHTNRLHH